MSAEDERRASALTGEALLAAQDERLQPLLDRLAEAAAGRDDLRAEVAGTRAGKWFAQPERQLGHELIAAGLLILCGVTDQGQVGEAVQISYERGKGASTAAQSFGIDPRVVGQTVSQVLSVFGIGGRGKAFTAALPKEQAVSQLQQVVAPYLSDPTFVKALNAWLKAAIEPVQAHKEGKAFQPDLSKSWLSDAWDTVSDAASSVDWSKVGQIGLQALPYVIAAM
jgi:hypothetical protein